VKNVHRVGTTGVAALTVAAAVVVPGTAHAAPPLVNDHYEFADSSSFDDCGFTIESEFTASGHFMLREIEGSDGQAFLGHDNYSYREVLTNPETGAFFVVHGKAMFKELTGQQVEGDIWEFTAQEVGQPFVVEDSDGNVVLRDRGRLTFRALFDTLGDGEPGGELLEQELTSISGPHPGFFADFCEIATELIG
jgi:hypothetical protein